MGGEQQRMVGSSGHITGMITTLRDDKYRLVHGLEY